MGYPKTDIKAYDNADFLTVGLHLALYAFEQFEQNIAWFLPDLRKDFKLTMQSRLLEELRKHESRPADVASKENMKQISAYLEREVISPFSRSNPLLKVKAIRLDHGKSAKSFKRLI